MFQFSLHGFSSNANKSEHKFWGLWEVKLAKMQRIIVYGINTMSVNILIEIISLSECEILFQSYKFQCGCSANAKWEKISRYQKTGVTYMKAESSIKKKGISVESWRLCKSHGFGWLSNKHAIVRYKPEWNRMGDRVFWMENKLYFRF